MSTILESLWSHRLKQIKAIKTANQQIKQTDLKILNLFFSEKSWYVHKNFPRDYFVYRGYKRYKKLNDNYGAVMMKVRTAKRGNPRCVPVDELLTEWIFVTETEVPEADRRKAQTCGLL
jgi:hypothetical protein